VAVAVVAAVTIGLLVPQEPERLLVTMAAAVAAAALAQEHPAMVVMAHKARLSLRIRLKLITATF
jgi:hypothetical protein